MGCFSFSQIIVYLMFSFKEDLKAQRGPFEDEKNIKGWGGPCTIGYGEIFEKNIEFCLSCIWM